MCMGIGNRSINIELFLEAAVWTKDERLNWAEVLTSEQHEIQSFVANTIKRKNATCRGSKSGMKR